MGFFPGVINMSKPAFPEKMLARGVKTGTGDYRFFRHKSLFDRDMRIHCHAQHDNMLCLK